jgi:universal stress protein A
MLAVARILCPVDFSEVSRLALAVAATVARQYGSHLEILHVTGRRHPPAEVIFAPPEPSEPGDHVVLGRELDEWSKEFSSTAGAPIPTSLRDGDPVEEICRVALEHGADLVVLGATGRRGLKQALLGSVAERITRLALCSVLTVRSPTRTP